jgi:hypothetical protein
MGLFKNAYTPMKRVTLAFQLWQKLWQIEEKGEKGGQMHV